MRGQISSFRLNVNLKNLRLGKFMIYFRFFCAFLFAISLSRTVYCYDYPNIKGSRVVSLGSGYQTATGTFLGQRVRGSLGFHGSQMGEWKFKTNLSSSEKAKLINGSAEASVNFKIFSASGSLDLDYVRKKHNNSFSQTLYLDVVGKSVQLDECEIADRMKSSIKKGNADRIFGDSFVDSITQGGRLILDIVINFDQKTDSTRVNGNVGLEIMQFIRGSAKADVRIESILKDTQITVKAKQVGGDPTKLSSMFEGGGSMISCGTGNYEKCTDLIRSVIKYGDKFGEQLLGLNHDPSCPLGPAVISFTTKSYEDEGLDVFPGRNPIVAREILAAQRELTEEYLSLIEDLKYIDERVNAGIGRNELLPIRDVVERNLRNLVTAINNSADLPESTVNERDTYRGSRLDYVDPLNIALSEGQAEIFYACDNCLKQEKLTPYADNKYRIMENGDIAPCNRCKSTKTHFECRGNNAVFLLSARKFSGSTSRLPGVLINSKISFNIADYIPLENLKTVVVELKK